MNLQLKLFIVIFTTSTCSVLVLGSSASAAAFLSSPSRGSTAITGTGAMKRYGVGIDVGVGAGFGVTRSRMHMRIPWSSSGSNSNITPSKSSSLLLVNGSRKIMTTRSQSNSRIHMVATSPPPSSSSSSSSSSSNPRITNDQIRDLHENGYVIIPNFISGELVSRLRDDVSNLRSLQKFNVAKIGQDSTNSLNTDIRIAETCFMGESKLQDVKNTARDDELYTILDTVRNDLSGNPMLDNTDSNTGELIKASPALDKSLTELLYAYYPKGGFYRRHTDAVPNSASILRSYSLLLYLNDGPWDSDANGGCLRIHLDSGKDYLPQNEAPNYVDVSPDGGTLVLFRSEQIPHEVLDTAAERTAVVGWYNRPYTSADISSLASEEDKVRGVMLMVAAGLVTFGVASILLG